MQRDQLLFPALLVLLSGFAAAQSITSLRVGTFEAEVGFFHTTARGLPDDDVLSVCLGADGRVYAGTRQGLIELRDGKWNSVKQLAVGEVEALARDKGRLLVVAGRAVYRLDAGGLQHIANIPVKTGRVNSIAGAGPRLLVASDAGLFELQAGKIQPVVGINQFLKGQKSVRQVAAGPDGEIAVAAMAGLLTRSQAGVWANVRPRNGDVSWAPHDVRGVAYDSRGRLWFASPQGVGCRESGWFLYDAADTVPHSDFTTLAPGEDGVIWFGTGFGAIRYDGRSWQYRQGRRWLPDNHVRSIAVDGNGNAWVATARGLAEIARRPMTLQAKSRFFEEEIDKRHRRTEYGYVSGVRLSEPGDTDKWTQHDTDNDGLWTSMYGAAQCFAFAATHDPDAQNRAKAAFGALRFLGEVTQGGDHPAPPGFVARTVLPTTGPNPNLRNTPERDRQIRATRDRSWKVIDPRWPTSADGKWYWKSDTSSDELDGHYFFYPLYYDLAASDEAEKARVRKQVADLTDHLIKGGFNLVDHDGKPTRWGVFSPEQINGNPAWREERGLNSLSMLSYLKVAEHVTGEARYREAAEQLIREHHYQINVLIGKTNRGPGSGNQSDDEMAFMLFYTLLRYETDPGLRGIYGMALRQWWEMERYELNPFFNFIAAASLRGVTFEDPFGTENLELTGDWLKESVDTLVRYPLDRVNWRLKNSHRKDLISLPDFAARPNGAPAGRRRDGTVLPIDERFVDHWNHDPWLLDQGGDGTYLADGTAFLLPYYMGLYYGFIAQP